MGEHAVETKRPRAAANGAEGMAHNLNPRKRGTMSTARVSSALATQQASTPGTGGEVR